jgi:linearmycin/streptolysin S transport system permease protein
VIAAVIRTSWSILKRDRSAMALSFVVPIAFFSIFAAVFGSQRDGGMKRVPLVVVDEDASESSKRLVAALAAESALEVRRTEGETARAFDRAAAEGAVRGGQVSVALVIPRGFGGHDFRLGLVADKPKLELLADSSDPIAARLVAGLLQKAAFSGAGEASASAPFEIETRDLLGENKRSSYVAFSAAGLGVMFLLFTAAGAGGALIEERESGTLDRLLATRISMTQLLAGKLAYLTSLGVTQLTVMFIWGWLVFGLELPSHLLGFFVMAVPTALASSAFGLVLASTCKTRKQLVAVSNLVILSISALGGSMFPRFLMPASVQKFSLVAFNSWALEGFLDVFWRERPLLALAPGIGVLLVWTAVFFWIARRIARGWEAA